MMDNFGVVELASAKTTSAPGWAYVPDVGPASSALGQPANRKRARNAPGPTPSIGDLSARQEAKARKELEALDKDTPARDAISLPSRAQGKHTPTVRKILASQKTFGNHLDDFLALQAQNEVNINPSAAHKRPNLSKKVEDDIPMPDAVFSEPILPPASRPPYPEHPGDNDPQLKSRIPELPTDAELRALLAAPPLSYVEARGEFEDEEWKKRRRVFCDVCGYWGRARCTRCGSRVCALECLELHREECITRYGM